ncbi:hypothetical protein DWB84_03555 [Saccharophagus sp. K07]|uniref:hypothetical protein n=1 Tax=Saccharophagus sp. K07 TaxID=2283636 RepID=UPI0016521DCF|nr:hypothetical protein [Saccharophagus sp. K07]MBC6904540.1 hypothetical protein [Saccharophagus sp. K07]
MAKHRARDGLEPPDELELEELDELEEFDELELDELLDDEPGSMGFFFEPSTHAESRIRKTIIQHRIIAMDASTTVLPPLLNSEKSYILIFTQHTWQSFSPTLKRRWMSKFSSRKVLIQDHNNGNKVPNHPIKHEIHQTIG